MTTLKVTFVLGAVLATLSFATGQPIVVLEGWDECDGYGSRCNTTWVDAPGMQVIACRRDSCPVACATQDAGDYDYCGCPGSPEEEDCHARHYEHMETPICFWNNSCGEATCSIFSPTPGVKCCKCILGS